jgi:hypothetical protein
MCVDSCCSWKNKFLHQGAIKVLEEDVDASVCRTVLDALCAMVCRRLSLDCCLAGSMALRSLVKAAGCSCLGEALVAVDGLVGVEPQGSMRFWCCPCVD